MVLPLRYEQCGNDIHNDHSIKKAEKGFSISDFNIKGLSVDGSKLFITLRETEEKVRHKCLMSPKVDIWTYFDPKMQSLQLLEEKNTNKSCFDYVVHTDNHKLVRLTMEAESVSDGSEDAKGDYVIVRNEGIGDGHEYHWNRTSQRQNYLVYTNDGSRKLITSGLSWAIYLSPEQKYVVYYDADQKNYFSYEIATGICHNITKGIATIWTSYERDDEASSIKYGAYGIAGWLSNDAAVLIYDQEWDIIKADLQGRSSQQQMLLTDMGNSIIFNFIWHLNADMEIVPSL